MAKKQQLKPSHDTHSHAESPKTKSVRMRFALSPEVKPVFANQMLVQSDGTSTYLSFFLLQPPVLLGSEDEVQKQVDELTELSANMVAQVIVPKEQLAKLIEAMATIVKSEPPTKAVLDSGANALGGIGTQIQAHRS